MVAGSNPSTQEPRRHPASTPSPVPSRKLITVVMPTSANVHGSASLITSDTGDGNTENDSPRSPCASCCQYLTYSLHRLAFGSMPNSTYSDCIASAFICPWKRASSDFTGSPGISRGMKKLMVSAAHAVKM